MKIAKPVGGNDIIIPIGQPHARLWIGIMLIYCLAWVASLPHPDTPLFQTGARTLVAMIAATIAVSSWVKADRLAQAATTLHGMRVPATLWRRWLGLMLASHWRYWTIASAVGGAITAWSNPESHWTGAPMLYSLAMALCTIQPLIQRRLLRPTRSPVIPVCLVAYLCLAGPRFFIWPMTLPWYVQLPLTAAWPLLAVWLARRWGELPPAKPSPFEPRRDSAWQSLRKWNRRLVYLSTAPSKDQNDNGGLLVMPLIVVWQSCISVETHLWGTQVSLIHILLIAITVPYARAVLFCRDLHWRLLLAPGGFRRGMLGWHIIASTLLAYARLLLPALLLFLLLPWLVKGISPMVPLDAIVRRAPVAAEVLFAICLGAALGGSKNGSGMLLYAGAAFLAALGLIAYGDSLAHLGLSRFGWPYMGLLAAGSLLAVILGNRLWKVERLLPYCMQGAAENPPPSGKWLPSLKHDWKT